jgi:hypothetical protein
MIFHTEEMATLVKTPMMLVGSVCSCDGTGFFSYWREMGAAQSFLRRSQGKYNALVDRVIEKLIEAKEKNETLDDFSHVALEEIEEHLEYTYDLMFDHPDGAGYMRFLYDLAEAVAAASGTGWFGAGSKITEKEANILRVIQEKLRVAA